MRIAMVFDGLGMGGIERVGIQYVALLIQAGHEVDVYNLQPEKSELQDEFEGVADAVYPGFLPLSCVPGQYMLMVKRWWWGKYIYPLAYLVSKLCMLALRAVQPKRRYDVAIAFSGHMRDLTFVAHGFVQAEKRMAWVHGAILEYLVLSPTFADLYRKIRNLCVLSTDRQEFVFSSHPYLSDDLSVHQLYNPIDLSARPPHADAVAALRRSHGGYILVVGRLDRDKDPATVIRARKILGERYGKTPHVVLVGDGSLRAELEAFTQSLELDDSVFFVGLRHDVEDFYASAQLFVHSSPSEGLPTVLLEAMKYGVPIVATDSPPGVSEILGSDRYGLRCRVGDAEDMAAKIATMLDDASLRERYRESGFDRVRDFSCDTISIKLNQILKNLR